LFYYLYVYGFVSIVSESVEMQIEKEQERFELKTQEIADEEIIEKGETDELDLLPEFCQYRDEGCKLSPSCLECPFPSCVEDRFWGRQKQVKNLRAREIVRLHTVEKMSVRQLSQKFNITRRTVLRVIASGRKQNE
jgi:hypothetical protein